MVGALLPAVVLASCGGGSSASSARQALSPATERSLRSVPLQVLASAAASVTDLNTPTPLPGPALVSNGKPELLYLGAEFCPVCAAERWPLVVALSKFGTFSNLRETTTGSAEGNMPTLSFYGSTYTSSYLTFTPVELYTNQRQGSSFEQLETASPDQLALWNKTLEGRLSFPFIDLGGRYLLKTSQFHPALLSGPSFATIAGSVGKNDTTIGANIDAATWSLMGYICDLTGQQPATACQGAPAPGG